MKNIENGLRQIREQSDNVFGYAVEFLNQMSEVSDERELRVIGGNIVDGMECLIVYQQDIVNRIDELVKAVEEMEESA